MALYDYRHELIQLLEDTSSDQASLHTTLQSINTIIHILNHYDRNDEQPVQHKFVQRQRHPHVHQQPHHQQRTNHSLLTGPESVPAQPAKPVTASEPVTAPQEVSQEERLAADDLYLVHRKLSGAEINHRYYNEAVLHSLHFPIADGNIVQLDPTQTVRGLPVIRRVTSQHLDDYEPTKIAVLEYATLTAVPGSDVLQISSTMKGNSILDEDPANTVVIDPFKYPGRTLKAGMVIDYAYVDNGNGLADTQNGSIRWIHEKQDYDTTKQPAKPKQVKKVEHPRHDYAQKLDYDLKQRIVLVITGDKKQVKELKSVVDQHHGVYHGLDASMEDNVSSSKIKRAIRDADFVIVCIDQIHHRISQLANHHAKRYDKPLAIANTSANTMVERAIGRALNGDPAYAASGEK